MTLKILRLNISFMFTGRIKKSAIRFVTSFKLKKSEERNDPLCSDISKLLREFRENLTDDRVPEHRDSHVSSSHESSLKSTRSVDLGKHSNYTHLSKDRNYEICKRTKITRVPCRRRNSGVVSRTKIFDDMITVFFFSWEALIKTTQLVRNICWLCNLKQWVVKMDDKSWSFGTTLKTEDEENLSIRENWFSHENSDFDHEYIHKVIVDMFNHSCCRTMWRPLSEIRLSIILSEHHRPRYVTSSDLFLSLSCLWIL